MNPSGVNLIPQDLQLALAGRRRMFPWAVVLGFGAIIVAAAGAYHWHLESKARDLHEQLLALQGVLETERGELKAITAEAAELQLRIQRADALRSKRPWSGLVALVASCLPPSCWLTALATDPASPAAAGSKRAVPADKPAASPVETAVTIEAPRKLRISGFAPDAAEPHAFVAQLKAAGAFEHVALERSSRENTPDGAFLRFEVVCEW